jgi:peptidoglycan/xylan/chitin deacetylase (PgdA/CDA1 family)
MSRWHRLASSAALAATLALTGAPAAARATLIRQGPASACRDVALTFDTEFAPTTQALADTLDQLHVRTTWFFLGQQVERYPQLVKQVAAHNEIGNHSFTHPVMTKLTAAQMQAEITRAGDAITRVAGVSPAPLFRPPYGEWNNTLLDVAGDLGYPYVFNWTVDTRDWAGPSAETIHQHILSHVFAGAVVLQHGSAANTVDAVRLTVPDLRARGYQFVTLTELIGLDRSQRDFGGDTYVVQPGDTWAQIGACHNVTGPRLAAYNAANDLTTGKTLQIPHTDELLIDLQGRRPELPVYPRVLPAGRAVAPVRLAEQLGAVVGWDGTRVHVTKGDKEILIAPGDATALVNGQPADMGAAPVTVSQRVLIPVRFLAEQLGYTVAWQGETRTVSLTPASQ